MTPIFGDPPDYLSGHNHSITISPNTNWGTSFPQPPSPSFGYPTQWYYGITTTATTPPVPETPPTSTEEKEVEFIVGDGKATSFNFPTTANYPSVRVFDRAIEGEDEEKTVTLSQSNATVTIVQGESVTVSFVNPPARRGAVILIK